ncbi:hypothetical protein [Pantoea sp. SS70]|uniref:hypothetical protein n=1 Tax=Pantoea sp. SS70 TaxID=3024247 RepID=UPI00245361D7|nr:hypothetical protein [Pantoea sp. SS70]WGK60051.1 hypothetical protein PO881_23175 [Pantoea sp. SS70]
MLSQLNLRFPRKLIDSLKSRASAEDTSVNALAGRFIEEKLMASAPDDEWLSLSADPGATNLSLYRKIVRGETFGRQALKPAELRWLFTRAHQATQTRSTFMSWPVMEALLDITFDALVYAAENGIPVDAYYINRAFDLKGEHYREEADRFMAGMRRNIDTTWAEFLLRPLTSGALNLEAFPDEAIACICTTERLKVIFPLLVRAQQYEPAALKDWAAATGLVTEDLTRAVKVNDVCLQVWIRGNRTPQAHGLRHEVPQLSLTLTADRVALAYGWEMFSELTRLFQARAWLNVTKAWSERGSMVGLYFPHNESEDVIISLDGVHFFVKPEEYLQLEAGFLATVAAPDVASVLDELRPLYGDL